nr:immunoglobulin light chain junction region [Macaca mulatta]MOW11088.1 immunoglobulin light chain junction region [Macaca mulatta]MOW12615.1 immunoglobulin light chain junction region [Macaca mulatta]
CQQHDTYPPSF